MTRQLTMLGVALAACHVANAAQISASLKPSAIQSQVAFPYRSAELAVRNPGNRMITAVCLRWRHGGPEIVVPTAVAPGSRQVLKVNLPAASPLQAYRVQLRGDDSSAESVLGELDLTITWPVEDVADRAFVDPGAYRPYLDAFPGWRESLRRNVFLGAVLACLAVAATLFVRPPAIRLIALAAVILAAATASAWAFTNADPGVELVEAQPPLPVREASEGDRLLVVACRRTVDWTHPNPRLAPVYYSREEMAEDTMVVDARNGVSVRLHPGRIRLFRFR